MHRQRKELLTKQLAVLTPKRILFLLLVPILILAGSVYLLVCIKGWLLIPVSALLLLSLAALCQTLTLIYTAIDRSELQLGRLRQQLRLTVENTPELPPAIQTALFNVARCGGIMTYAGSQKDVALNKLVITILDGVFSSSEEINQALSHFHERISGSSYVLVLFHTLEIPDDAFDFDIESTLRTFGYPNPLAAFFRTVIGDMFRPGFTCTICEMNGIFKGIVTANEELSSDAMLANVQEICNRIVTIFETCFSITMLGSISQVRRDYGKIRESSDELTRLMECRTFIGDTHKVLLYDDLAAASGDAQTYQLGIRKSQELVNSLAGQQFDTAREICRNVLQQSYESSDGSYMFTRFLLNDMAYACLFSTGQPAIKDVQNMYQKLLNTKSIQEYSDFFDTLINELESDSTLQSEANFWTKKMAAYIDEHYMERELSVSTVSTLFHYNPIYATKIFKQEIGQNISDYIQNQRLDHSRQMLGKGYTIKEIADSCGFSSASAMNRIYNKTYGISPGKLNVMK